MRFAFPPRAEDPLIPWKRIAGARNIVIRHYFGVDLETGWFSLRNNFQNSTPFPATPDRKRPEINCA
jgi:uncharacterized protein with HEPN domain